MNCPACKNVNLLMMERQEGRPAEEKRPVEVPPRYVDQHDKTYERNHDEGRGQYQPHRKKSFLSDLFD
jgi:Zn-finger nucleic acid-binding protein